MAATAAPAGAGVISHLRELGASLCEHIALRVELAGQELSDEKARLATLAVAAILFCGLAMAALLFAGIAALALAWDTPQRMAVALGVLAAFSIGAVAAGFWLHSQLNRSTGPFAASIAELRRDAAMLARPPV